MVSLTGRHSAAAAVPDPFSQAEHQNLAMGPEISFSPMAFKERVTFWLQRSQSLSCFGFAALYVCVIA